MDSSASTSLPSMMSLRVPIALLRRFLHGHGGPAMMFGDAPFDFGPEMTDEPLNRPRRAFAEGADGVAFDLLAHFIEQIDLFDLRIALLHAGEHTPHPAAALAAWRALAAAFVPVEIGEPRKRLDDV